MYRCIGKKLALIDGQGCPSSQQLGVTTLNSTVEVFQREYGIAATRAGHRRIITTGVTTCTIWLGWDSTSGVAFLAHFDYPWTAQRIPKILNEVAAVARPPYNFQSVLWGGKSCKFLWSHATRKAIINEIAAYESLFSNFKIRVTSSEFHSGICQVGYGLNMVTWEHGVRAPDPEIRISRADRKMNSGHLYRIWEPIDRAPASLVPTESLEVRLGPANITNIASSDA